MNLIDNFAMAFMDFFLVGVLLVRNKVMNENAAALEMVPEGLLK